MGARRRRRALLAAAAVLVAACSGRGGGTFGFPSAVNQLNRAVELSQPVPEVVDALTDAFGPLGGASALLLALDKGFSINQVADAISDVRLTPAGLVEAIAGGFEEPEGTPLGRFTPITTGLRAPPENDALAEFIDALTRSTQDVPSNDDRPDAASNSMVRLEVWGYPLAQVLDAVPGGYTVHDEDSGATLLFDADGRYVCPAKLEGEIDCADLQEDLDDLARDVLPDGVFDDDDGPTPDTTQGASEGEICTAGTAELVGVQELTVREGTFALCFPEDGGATRGRIDFVADVADADCTATLTLAGELDGAYTAPDLAGLTTVTGSVEPQSGDCVAEREFGVFWSDGVEVPWSATFDGTNLVGSITDEEGNAVVFLTGSRS